MQVSSLVVDHIVSSVWEYPGKLSEEEREKLDHMIRSVFKDCGTTTLYELWAKPIGRGGNYERVFRSTSKRKTESKGRTFRFVGHTTRVKRGTTNEGRV
jgi:hypothetical protein